MLLTLVQQFAHLLDRERLVLALKRFLALALVEERPGTRTFADGCRFIAFRRDACTRCRRRCDHGVVFRQLRTRRNIGGRIAGPEMSSRELARSKSVIFWKSFRDWFLRRIKTAGGRCFIEGGHAFVGELFVLRRISERRVWFQQAIHQSAFLLLSECGDDADEE